MERAELPYLTADLPGVGGVIKRHNEDFEVEEIPAYEPSGSGTHVYFGIEKRGLTTWQAIEVIARGLGRSPRDIGYAGMKDAHAVTRQTLSIEHVDPAQVERLEPANVRIRWISRHSNKIKLGHLRGNRFSIKIREVGREARGRAEAILAVLGRRGVPNYFGPQRFGARGDNAAVGLAVARGDYAEAVARVCGRPTEGERADIRRARGLFDEGKYLEASRAWPHLSTEQRRLCRAMDTSGGDAERAWRAIDRQLARLYVSALQSELFNRVLAARIGEIDRLAVGDVAWKHVNGAVFVVEDAAAEQPRCDAFEISATGPLFGQRMKAATGAAGVLEAGVLGGAGLTLGDLGRDRRCAMEGSRRPLRCQAKECRSETGEDDRGVYLRVAFALEPGCYATSLTREVCKGDE